MTDRPVVELTDRPDVELLTAEEAEVRQRRAAGALAASGLGPGDRVAFCLPSSARLLCAVLGALRSGVVPVLLNATLVPSEREALVADARPSLIITDVAGLAALDGGPPMDLSPYPRARPMHYTSGTTGRAKGVWTGLWDEHTAAAAFADEAELWDFGPSDVHLVCSPMYHSVSVRFAAGTLLSGGTCVILGRFDAAAALACPVRRGRRWSPRRRSWLRPRSSGSWPSGKTCPGASSRSACWPTPARPAHRRSSGPPWTGWGPGCSGSSTAPPRASSRCAHRPNGSIGPGPSVGPGPGAG